MAAKFKKGDRCITEGIQVIVLEVLEPSAWRPDYQYNVEILGGYATMTVGEQDLQLDSLMLVTLDDWCDCGAKHIFGMENCHSFWCTAYRKKENS